MIQLNSNVAMPKVRKSKQETRNKIFRKYANAYAAVFTARPDDYVVLANGYIAPVMGNRQMESMSLARMKQLTRVYSERALQK